MGSSPCGCSSRDDASFPESFFERMLVVSIGCGNALMGLRGFDPLEMLLSAFAGHARFFRGIVDSSTGWGKGLRGEGGAWGAIPAV